MLLIFTSAITSRLSYIADLMIRKMLGTQVNFTTSLDEYLRYAGPKLSYTSVQIPDGIFIEASGLLFENEISPHELKLAEIEGVPVLFRSANPDASMSFDPFAAAFYMVSRYEEYLPFKRDSYGRFPVKESIAFQGKFLDIPVVHLWVEMLGKILQKHFPGLNLRRPEYRYVPTIDVDHAWCYRCRPLMRTVGGIGRSLLYGQFHDITLRMRVLAGRTADPYDNYDYIRKVHETYSDKPLFFILFADYGGDDNNVKVSSETFHRLLRELDKFQGVGLHPSLSSNKHFLKLKSEYNGLSRVLDREVTMSRQHFLKLSMPKTYLALVQLGIRDDYSMGYASVPGFRAGIAIPFPFYDLTANVASSLIIHPVSLMDVTMKDYLRLSQEKSLEMIRRMIQTTKAVNGEFVSLWHNESLGETDRWLGWRNVFEEMVKMAST